MRLRAVLGTLFLAVVGIVALAGGGGEPLAPEAAIAQAATRATATGSFRVSTLMTGTDFQVHGSGAVDTEHSRGTLTLHVDPSDALRTDLTPAGHMTTEIVYEGHFAYIRGPVFADVPPRAKPWLSTAISEEELAGSPFNILDGFSPSPLHDPAGMLDFLRATSGRVEELGSEEVRGVQTIHYRATVDLEQAAAQATGFRRETLHWELELRREKNLPTSWPVEVWIGDDGLARRLRTEDQADDIMDFTIEYFDYGDEVDVALPSADDVMTFEEFTELVPEDPAGFACSDGTESDEPDVTDETTEWEPAVGFAEYCIEIAPADPDGG